MAVGANGATGQRAVLLASKKTQSKSRFDREGANAILRYQTWAVSHVLVAIFRRKYAVYRIVRLTVNGQTGAHGPAARLRVAVAPKFGIVNVIIHRPFMAVPIVAAIMWKAPVVMLAVVPVRSCQ